jgi:hypothetical protein
MTAVRSVLLAAVLVMAFPGGALALPSYEGGQMFPTIHGAEDPEEYSWEVQLGDDQELEQVDDQLAVVRSKTGAVAWSINATQAHDGKGATVPTALAVTQPNVVTLTVHHVGAGFQYPISAGEGYETGFATVAVIMPPGEQPPAAPTCDVPDLTGRSLRASRRILHRAHCRLGLVRGERSPAARVLKQYRLAGKSLPAWTAVGVKVS